MTEKQPLSNAEMKLKELELKKQLASEVNPSLKDIQTIKRRLDNLQSKLLMKDRAIYIDPGDAENSEEKPEILPSDAPDNIVGN